MKSYSLNKVQKMTKSHFSSQKAVAFDCVKINVANSYLLLLQLRCKCCALLAVWVLAYKTSSTGKGQGSHSFWK